MGLHFQNGAEYEEIIETARGQFWITASVSIFGTDLELDDFLLYSVTSKRISAAYRDLRQVFRHIEDAAREDGFTSCTLNAFRTKGTGRILSRRRTLR